MRTDVAVVYTPVGGGHKAAAIATAEAARARGLTVELVDLFELAPRIVGETYLAAHVSGQSSLPTIYGYGYRASNRRDGAFEPVRLAFDNLVFAKLATRIRELAPRVVVGTHHLPLVVLGRERRRGRLAAPLLGVVTDYTAHAAWAEAGVDAFAVPCARAARELRGHGVDPRRVVATGIPVRPAFERIAPLVQPRPGARAHVLLTSGGFGVGPMRAVVRSFAGIPDVHLTVVCGASEALFERVKDDAALAGVEARVIGFERDMPARLAECHAVVGKAGGLTVSEALTAGRPMIIVGTPPGNETANEAFVMSAGAGRSCDAAGVGALVRAAVEVGTLEELGAAGRRAVLRGTAARVVETAWRLALHGADAMTGTRAGVRDAAA